MRRIAIAVTTLGLLLAAAPPALAEVCADADEVLALSVPSHVSAGSPFTVTVDSSALAGQVSGATLDVAGAASAIDVPEFDVVTRRFTAPSLPGPFAITLRWSQTSPAEDTAAAPPCEGSATVTVTTLRAGLRIGDMDAPRVDGLWNVHQTPINWRPQPGQRMSGRTRVTSRCDVGGCPFALGPASAKAPALAISGDGRTYTRESPKSARPRYSCGDRSTGRVFIRDAYFEQLSWRLRVVNERRLPSGELRATRLSGVFTRAFIPTGYARSRCNGGQVRTRIVMTRR